MLNRITGRTSPDAAKPVGIPIASFGMSDTRNGDSSNEADLIPLILPLQEKDCQSIVNYKSKSSVIAIPPKAGEAKGVLSSAIIRRFSCYFYIMRMAFFHSRIGDLNKSRFFEII